MGVQVPIGEFLVVLQWRLTGDLEPMISTLGIRSDLPNRLPAEIGAAVRQSLSASELVAPQTMLTVYRQDKIAVYQQTAGGQIVFEDNVPVIGTLAFNAIPQNSAVLIRKGTALGGRRNRGRMYLPPYTIDELAVDPTGTLSQPAQTALQARLNAFLTALDVRDCTPVLFHSDGAASTPITNLTCDTRLATQRKRMRR